MQQGFIVDNNHLTRGVAHWAPGAPQSSFWSGTQIPKELLPLGAFRCLTCGYLEFYAGNEFAAQ
jgi:hypothetical protein